MRYIKPEASWGEIAEALGITETEARRHFRRALARMRQWLEAEGYTREDVAELFG